MKLRIMLPICFLCITATPLPASGQDAKPAEVRIERGLVFGKGGETDLRLDLAMPKEGDGPFPAVVCIHGGGWRGGERQELAHTIESLARWGYVAVSIDYRLVPAHKFPAQIEDCKAAVRWLRANADKYRINPDRIGALGFSAGAHLACLIGTTDKPDGLEGKGGNADHSSRVQAVVSFFGPTDFTARTWSKDLEKEVLIPFVGAAYDDKPELYRKISPLMYVTRNAPPFLFFHGSEDKLVAPRHSKLMAEKLQAAGVEAKVVILEGEGHGWGGEKLVKSIEQTLKFLDGHLKK